MEKTCSHRHVSSLPVLLLKCIKGEQTLRKMNLLLCQIFWHTRLIRSWYHGCKLGRLKMSLYRLFILVILRCMCLMKLPVFIECGVKDFFFFLWGSYFYSHKPETITAWVNWGSMNALKAILEKQTNKQTRKQPCRYIYP